MGNTTKHLIVFVFVVTLSIGMLDGLVSAHRSGCHRWHSCPSDSGSYTCGDTGYDNYCGTEQTYVAPDYEGQGRANGQDHASKDSAQIEQLARTSAETNGRQHGRANQHSTSNADTTLVCDKKFTFDAYQPSAYTQAYHDAYLSACNASYTATYGTSYPAAYQSGLLAYQEEQKAAAESAKATELKAAKVAEEARVAQIEAKRVAKMRKAVITDNSEWILGTGVLGAVIIRQIYGRRQRQ